jgi:ribonuclease P protein subunit RPR2
MKEKKTIEKKIKGNQKLALERMYRLFELAERNEKYSKRYVSLAKRIGEKCRVTMPKELKIKRCKKCDSLKVKHEKKAPFLLVKCDDCGSEKKYRL